MCLNNTYYTEYQTFKVKCLHNPKVIATFVVLNISKGK